MAKIHELVLARDKDRLTIYLSQGNINAVDTNKHDEHGNTALHYAVSANDAEIVLLLLNHYAQSNRVDATGTSPLLLAAQNCNLHIIKILLAHRADSLHCNHEGVNFLHLLLSNIQELESLKQVMAKLSDYDRKELIQSQDNNGRNLLHFAANSGNSEIVTFCHELGVPLNKADKKGFTALHYAAKNGYSVVVETLIELGCDPYQTNINGDNVIHVARRYGYAEIATMIQQRLLVQHISLPSEDHTIIARMSERDQHFNAYFDIENKKAFEQGMIDENQEGLAVELAFMNKQLMFVKILNQDIITATEFRYPLITCDALLEASDVFLLQRDFQKGMMFAAAASAYFNKQCDPAETWMAQRISAQITRALTQFYQISFRAYEVPIMFDYLVFKKRLYEHRERMKPLIDDDCIDVESILTNNTDFFIQLTADLFSEAIQLFKKQPPCQYCLIGLGSMGRGEMSLYSDLEFAIVIAEDNDNNHHYFKQVSQIMDMLVIALGETPTAALAKKYSPTPTGFHFDDGGNSPLNDEFIATAEALANIQLLFNDDQFVIQRNALRTVCFIHGDNTLFEAYESLLKQVLDKKITRTNSASRKFFKRYKTVLLRQHEAAQVMQGDLKEFSPHRLAQQKHDFGILSFNIKTELYRLPSQTIANLSLFYNVSEKGTWQRIRELCENGALSEEAAQRLSVLMSIVTRLRLKTHAYYGTELESLHHENMLEPITDPREMAPYLIDDALMKTLESLYHVLIPLYSTLNDFVDLYQNRTLKDKTNPFAVASLKDSTNIATAVAYERLYQPEEAKKWYLREIQLNPNNVDLQINQLNFLQQQREVAQTIIDHDKALINEHIEQLVISITDQNLPKTKLMIYAETLTGQWQALFMEALRARYYKLKWDVAPIQFLQEQISSDSYINRYHEITDNLISEPELKDLMFLVTEIRNFRPLTEKFVALKLNGLQQCFQQAPVRHHHLFLIILLYQRSRLLLMRERGLEKLKENIHRALDMCINIIIRNKEKAEYYSKTYQQLAFGIRQGFRQHILNYIQQGDPYQFLNPILRGLNTFPDESGHQGDFAKLKTKWRRLLGQLVEDPSNKSSKAIRLLSPLLGIDYDLNSKVQQRLFKGRKKFQEETINGSRHQVIAVKTELGKIYIKANPEMPGMTHLIELFHQRIIGHGTCLSELARLNIPGKKDPLPVLLSQGIEGPTLHEVLTEQPERLQQLDHRYYSELVFLAMLTNPEDGIPTNFIVATLNTGKLSLVSVDHDHALFPAYLMSADTGSTELQIKTILFCFDQMNERVDPVARERFLALHPAKLLRAMLRDAQQQNMHYQQIFNDKSIKKLYKRRKAGSTAIPIPIKRGDISKLYSKFVRLQQLLKSHPEISLLQCLLHLEPRVGLVYQRALQEFNDPIIRLEKVGNYPSNEKGELITHTQALRTLMVQSTLLKHDAYFDLKDLRPEEGLAELDYIAYQQEKINSVREDVQNGKFELFRQLLTTEMRERVLYGDRHEKTPPIDLSKLSRAQQLELLVILKTTPMQILNLSNCNALDENLFYELIDSSPDLLELDLSGCAFVKDEHINYINEHCQTLQSLTLKNINQIHNIQGEFPQLHLLTISQASVKQIDITSPELEICRADGCENLSSIRTGSSALRHLDLRGCHSLPIEGLCGIADTQSPSSMRLLHHCYLHDCTRVSFVDLLTTFPFLIGINLEKVAENFLQRLYATLSQILAEYGLSLLNINLDNRKAMTFAYIQHGHFQQLLTECLTNVNSECCIKAINTLTSLGSLKTSLFEKIIQLLVSEDEIMTLALRNLIVSIIKTDQSLLSLLLPSLNHANEQVRINTAKVLHSLGELSSFATVALKSALSDPSGKVREESARALGVIPNLDQSILDALVQTLGDLLEEVRDAARIALRKQFADRPDLIETLLALTKHTRDLISQQAILMLSEIPHSRQVIQQKLLTLMTTAKQKQRIIAIQAIRQLSFQTNEVIEALENVLTDQRLAIRIEAAKTLIAFNIHSILVGDVLLEGAKIQEWGARLKTEAVRGLVKYLASDPRVMDILIDFNRQRNLEVRRIIVAGFSDNLHIYPELMPHLQRATGDPDPYIRQKALLGLQPIAYANEEIIACVFNALSDQDASVVSTAKDILIYLCKDDVTIQRKLAANLNQTDLNILTTEILLRSGFQDESLDFKILELLQLYDDSITASVLTLLPLLNNLNSYILDYLLRLHSSEDSNLITKLESTLLTLAQKHPTLQAQLTAEINSANLNQCVLAMRALTLQMELLPSQRQQLHQYLNSDYFILQLHAAATLLKAGYMTEQIVTVLQKAITYRDTTFAPIAIDTISHIKTLPDLLQQQLQRLIPEQGESLQQTIQTRTSQSLIRRSRAESTEDALSLTTGHAALFSSNNSDAQAFGENLILTDEGEEHASTISTNR